VHIIIFAKRDINPWEELTYDYRLNWRNIILVS
jgi:SET domain-containing protein